MCFEFFESLSLGEGGREAFAVPFSLWEKVAEGRMRAYPKPLNPIYKAKAVKCKIKSFNSKVQSFHSCGASYFSLLVQRKVTKRKHTLPTRPARYAVGVRSASGIFRQDILVLSKNSHIHVLHPDGSFRWLHRYGFMGPQKR